MTSDSIPLEYDELVKVYEEANKGKKAADKVEAPKEDKQSRRSKKSEEPVKENTDEVKGEIQTDKSEDNQEGVSREKINQDFQEVEHDNTTENLPQEDTKTRRRRRKAE